MVCKETTRCDEHGYLFPEEVKDGKCTQCDQPVTIGKTEKMSKSLKNVVDPDYLIKAYGADTARIFCLFASPPEKDLEWSDQGVDGSFRFLSRTWRIILDYLEEIGEVAPFAGGEPLEGDLKALRRKTHQTIRKVTDDIEKRFRFNTAIAAMMELVNDLYRVRETAATPGEFAVVKEAVESLLVMLSPFVPHIAQELWETLGHAPSLQTVPWPSYDPALCVDEAVTVVVQVNGKVRGRLSLPADASPEQRREAALACPEAQGYLAGKEIVKVVVPPNGTLVSIVVK